MPRAEPDAPWPEDDRRRSREEILDAVERRIAMFAEDLASAASPFNPEWSPRRRKVYQDAHQTSQDAPIYLKLNAAIATAMVKGRNQQPVAQFNVLVLGDGTIPLDKWKERAAELEKQDAIDVKALEPVKEPSK